MRVSLLTFALLLAAVAARADEPAPAWRKPPGPIAGQWKVTCATTPGMVVEVTVEGQSHALGKVAVLGDGGKRGYKEGDPLLDLTADDFGDWVGKLKWKDAAGTERDDPIHFIATQDVLDATMTTDDCYKKMPRVK